MTRSPLSPATDKAIFSRTASQIKAVNLFPTVFRGGYRF